MTSQIIERCLGIDVGAETIKIAELTKDVSGRLTQGRTRLAEHHKNPVDCLLGLLKELDWSTAHKLAITGRGSRLFDLPRVPTRAALERGARFLCPTLDKFTVVSIGSHGFSVLELRGQDNQVYRENSRCSQGTGNFLRQLVERFDLTIEEASALAEDVNEASSLSGRCPVILKTDMTHLANKGQERSSIIAGLYDAVCENVQVLVKPRLAPPQLVLLGGVALSKRVRSHFERFANERGMRLLDGDPHQLRMAEALGAAVVAASGPQLENKTFERLVRRQHSSGFERIEPLESSLPRVRRMPSPPLEEVSEPCDVVLGFDMGSTGSKMLALTVDDQRLIWKGYLNTLGDPVSAARRLTKRFLEETGERHRVRLIGTTGSGREIVGSLASACYGPDQIFVLNEIAAHARGALSFDPRVDTIFEIGGQDAKYIRLEGGQVSDAAMNEACSAGTGSFIEEQGSKFAEVEDVVQMGQLALSAEYGISLGQHCSVFMAEVIEEAVANGVPTASILAGIYDSIVQNYLNRVKGSRSVGQHVFCQGMPFASDALAAAVARQTGCEVIIPPDPGTIGALGIAMITLDEMAQQQIDPLTLEPVDLRRFMESTVKSKDTFVCKSKKGCGGVGNRCRIDRLRTTVAGQDLDFVWGGGCSLWDRAQRSRKLPFGAPDPFRERRALLAEVKTELEELSASRAARGETSRGLVAMSDEFSMKGLLPFFATFIEALGFEVHIHSEAGQSVLKRGIEEAAVPFCAPMQLFQGVVAEALEQKPDFFFAPRLRELPRQENEVHAVTCAIVQASPELVESLFAGQSRTRLIRTRIDMGPGNLDSERFRATTQKLASELGAQQEFEQAFARASEAQLRFERARRNLGEQALSFARKHGVVPVVVLGRDYTIYNDVLNSNVPALLRGQGALPIPVDCYPIGSDSPMFDDIYWGHSQTTLRAAHDIRRQEGVYAFFCSNYSCGPDSFSMHFASYIMEGKPFALVETDGHSGDAGTKTRVEAFLYCVESDLRRSAEAREAKHRNNFKAIEVDKLSIQDTRRRGELLLIPRMGPNAEVVAALLRSEGFRAEALPMPTRDHLRAGRRHTSGKECLPMVLTLGSMLERLKLEQNRDERFALLMPTADGPCRFGVYNLLHKIVLEKTGWSNRVHVVTPTDANYFDGLPKSFRFRIFTGFVACDMLIAALHDVRPVETRPGAAEELFERYFDELVQMMEVPLEVSLVQSLGELPNGVFGLRNLLRRAARDFAAVKDMQRDIPTVAVVGEIYVRLDPFANDFIVEKLNKMGIRALMAPFTEWLEYTTYCETQRVRENRGLEGDSATSANITYAIEVGIMDNLYQEMAQVLGWPPRTSVEMSLDASKPFVNCELVGEAVLTVGGPVYERLHDHIDGVVSVGPHECLPNKVAEAQFVHAREQVGLLSLTLPMNGDPIDPEVIEAFVFEVREHHAARKQRHETARRSRSPFEFLGSALEMAKNGNLSKKLLPMKGRALLQALKMFNLFGERTQNR